jgi:DNA-binding NarL/FixJ family response regulator
MLLGHQEGVHVMAATANDLDAIKWAEHLRPDVLIVDVMRTHPIIIVGGLLRKNS